MTSVYRRTTAARIQCSGRNSWTHDSTQNVRRMSLLPVRRDAPTTLDKIATALRRATWRETVFWTALASSGLVLWGMSL